MNATALRLDLELCRYRTRRTMTVSAILHALLFIWVMTIRAPIVDTPPITEITMIDPGDLAGSAAAPSNEPQSDPSPGTPSRLMNEDRRFIRTADRADVSLDPQANIVADQLSARLAALTQNRPPVVGSPGATVPTSLFGTGPAKPGTGTGTAPVALSRGGALGGAGALPLNRGGRGTSSVGGPATLPSVKSGGGGPAQVGDAAARRTIAGASVAGPIADRAVLHTEVPEYPEWAKKEAVEGSVTLYFVVRSDGTVKENVVIQKTAGFGDFDENARIAIRGWRFEPLRGGRTGEQWGTITFHFRLRDAG